MKGGHRFLPGLEKSGPQGNLIARHPHALASPTSGGLDDDGIADAGGDDCSFILVFDQTIRTRNHGNTGGKSQIFGPGLVSAIFDNFRRRSDEVDLAFPANGCEVGVFSQETVPGVNGFDICDFGGRDNLRNVQIGFRALSRTNANGVVSLPEPGPIPVRLRKDCDGLHPEVMACPDDSERNFSAVGNQNPLEHGISPS